MDTLEADTMVVGRERAWGGGEGGDLGDILVNVWGEVGARYIIK